MKMEGHEVCHNDLTETIFSAPNYCDTQKNKGAYIILKNKDNKLEQEIKQFKEVIHPNVKPMQ